MSSTELDELRAYSRTQDAQVFARLVDSHGGLVYGVCLRMLRNPADAEDVAQETFLALARKAGEVRTSVAGWLHARATTLCLTRLQRERNRRAREQEYAAQRSELAAEATWEQIGPEVDRALADLPDETRDLLVQHFLQRRQQAQLAAEMNVSPATISRRLAEGVELLRSKLQLRGIGVSAAVLGPMLLEHAFTEVPATLVTELGKMALAGLGQATAKSLSPILASVAAIVVVGVVAAGIWATGNRPATTAATKPAGTGVQVMNTSRKVLEGVPRVGYNIHVCPFPGSLYACLQYMGEKPDYDLISATSGAAWRRFYNRDDGGNVDLMYLGDTVWEHAFTALGLEYQHVPPTDRDALIKAVKASIDANRPVISYGIHGPPEAGVITGYDNDGRTLIGWNYFFDNSGRYYEKADWQPRVKEGLGFVTIGQKKSKPSDRETLISTLRFAIDLARTPKRQSHPDHVTGLAAYDAWADGLLVDADFPAGDKKELDTRTMILGDQLAMLIERRYGGNYLRKMAAAAPEAKAELEAAAALLTEVAQAEPQIYRGGGSFDHRNLVQRPWRMQMADAIRQAGQKERQAIEQMEKSLAILSPPPATADLKTPTPNDLSRGGRRAPEAMPAAIAMRAMADLLSINPSRAEPTTMGEWRIDANQTLMMAITGESFRWEWFTKPDSKPNRDAIYYSDDPRRPYGRALWAMGLHGDVLIGQQYGGRDELSQQDLQQQIVQSLHHRQLPAILITEGPIGELFLVGGYGQSGSILRGWRTAGGGPSIIFERNKCQAEPNWFVQTRGAIVLRGRSSTPSLQQVTRMALEDAVRLLQRTEVGPFLSGQAMHQEWCRQIVDPALDARDEATSQRRLGVIDPLIWDLAERRWYGSLFLKKAATVFPAAADELNGAGDDFQQIHDLMYAIMRTGGGQSPGSPIPNLHDPEVRRKIAGLMAEAAAHDADACTKIELALKKLQ